MNFRCAVIFGRAREITEPVEKRAALARFLDHVAAGRSEQVPPPPDGDVGATCVVALPIREASLKARSGPPARPRATAAEPPWTGVIPVALVRGAPIPG
jgi:nitroimidazol reductase NimA-like FMN-containing flavoprotein (pyridoxamine 5'-phosphate oxidase superfamily)